MCQGMCGRAGRAHILEADLLMVEREGFAGDLTKAKRELELEEQKKERRIEKKPIRVAKCCIVYFVYFPSVSRDIII